MALENGEGKWNAITHMIERAYTNFILRPVMTRVMKSYGHAVAYLVEALWYKPKSSEFES
jgi:hypothetical protein